MVEVGQIISGKYKLVRLLGDGGMGSVYEAEHLGLGTHVAIKVVHAELTRRAGLIERFLQEARVSAQIKSLHVVRVMDVDRTPEGVAYLVMELLQGEPLFGLIRREGKLSVATATEYTSQILEALEAAHALGVIHRDLKPDNVFVTFEGGKPVLKLIDFGIAKLKRPEGSSGKNLTVAGMLMGTPEYMAPEQAYSADKVDVRADLYSVGAMLYEMLSGKAPVSGEDPRVVVLKVERGEVEPLVKLVPGIQPEVAGFVHRAMAPSPDLRFATATEMRLALEAIANGKRAQTARMPQAAVKADGTGTMMGAPAPGALSPPTPIGSFRAPGDRGAGGSGGTAIAPPMDPGAAATPPPATHHHHALTQTPRPARSGMGLVIGLAVIALLLGAGAVVAYVWSTTPATPGPDLVLTPPTAPTPPPTTPATGPTPPTIVTTTTPLTPPPKLPHTPPPRPSGNAPPPPPPSGNAPPPPIIPPIVFPSGLPSAIPFPSGFPSAIPFPSAFPPLFQPPPPSPPQNP